MKCPICEKPTTWQGNPNRPFCSERCRTIDLGKWSAEEYSVSVPLQDVSEEADQPQKKD